MANYCVYRYMIGDQWIYVGKAAGTIHQRVRAHARDERFKPYLPFCKISFFEVNHESDMNHAEAAIIKIMKPILNIANKNNDLFPFIMDTKNIHWTTYMTQAESRHNMCEDISNSFDVKCDSAIRKRIGMLNDWKQYYTCKLYSDVKYIWGKMFLSQILTHELNEDVADKTDFILPKVHDKQVDLEERLNCMIRECNIYDYEYRDKDNVICVSIRSDDIYKVKNYWESIEETERIYGADHNKMECDRISEEFGLNTEQMFMMYDYIMNCSCKCA